MASDSQYLLVLDTDGNALVRLMPEQGDGRTWNSYEVNLLDYVGQTIRLHFGVYNDGIDGPTGMYVDDVSLLVCWP
jgi:hypothetical protein